MNLQNIMKQAQAMQKNMLAEKAKIDSKDYEGKSELVDVVMSGNRTLKKVNIKNKEDLTSDDIEILEDMIMIAVNDALKKIEKDINQKLGSQTGGLGGLL